MSDIAIRSNSAELQERVRQVEDCILHCTQWNIETEHTLHAGLYARTVRVPAGVVFANVLIKIPTLVIIHGVVDVLDGKSGVRLEGYNVVSAPCPRKHVYITRTDIEMTMIFPTNAQTVAEAEAEFTDEVENLMSRRQENGIVVTEEACQESLSEPRS